MASATVKKVLVTLCLLFLSFSSFAIGFYSFFQIGDTSSSDGGFTISCGDDPYSDNHPLRFQNTETDSYVECGWAWGNTITRLSVSTICGVFPFLTIFFGIYKKKKWAMWSSTLLCFGAMLIFIGALVLDTEDVTSSLSWCNDYSLASDCSYSPFFGMILLEGIVLILWCLLGVGMCFYCSKHMKADYADFIFDYSDDYGNGH